ncbi:MAG TPA: hypothetical protein VIC06_10180 [Solirubrobacteraceae bacterium]|jgi:phage terminase Nu1 subunit (DNA packaging protein)
MNGQVVQLPVRGGADRIVTKQQLASHLGRSPRWVEMRVKDGMPVIEGTDRYGRRRYNLRECEAWLNGGRPKPAKREDRLTVLEREVAELRAQVGELRRAG